MIGFPVRVYEGKNTLAGIFFFIGNLSFPIKKKTLREDAITAPRKIAYAIVRKVGKPTLFRLKIREGRRLIMEQVHYELQGQSLIVYVTKELDHHAVIDLRATSDKLIQAGNVKHIIFDFSDVDFMDSSGIGLIMGRHKKVMFLGGKTAVTGVGKNIDRIFRMSGLYQIVEKYVTPQEAVENL